MDHIVDDYTSRIGKKPVKAIQKELRKVSKCNTLSFGQKIHVTSEILKKTTPRKRQRLLHFGALSTPAASAAVSAVSAPPSAAVSAAVTAPVVPSATVAPATMAPAVPTSTSTPVSTAPTSVSSIPGAAGATIPTTNYNEVAGAISQIQQNIQGILNRVTASNITG